MDRSRERTSFEMEDGETRAHALGSSCTFQPDQLRVDNDLLIERRTGVVIGRMWAGLKLRDIESITITSSRIEIEDGGLVISCSHCRRQVALVEMGLRKMHSGRSPVRNQPQCPECRGRYRK